VPVPARVSEEAPERGPEIEDAVAPVSARVVFPAKVVVLVMVTCPAELIVPFKASEEAVVTEKPLVKVLVLAPVPIVKVPELLKVVEEGPEITLVVPLSARL